MLTRLSNWLEGRRRRRAAVDAAVRHFDAAGAEQAHRGISRAIAETANGFVVRVYYGHFKPPRRKWYLVGAGGSSIEELSFDEVRQYGEQLSK